MKIKIILVGVLSLFSVMFHSVFAAPAVPWPVEKIQPDGTKITVYLKGDEKVHWMESLDGYTLMYNSKKNIVYAEQDADGNIVPSKVKFTGQHSDASNIKEIKKGLRYSRSQVETLKQIWEIGNSGPQRAAPNRAPEPVVGDKKALCILVGFDGKPFSKSVNEFTNLMNQKGYSANGAQGSVQDFYLENSYGQMTLTVTVVGAYTLPNSASYYASREQEFARLAAMAADADVNYSDFANANHELETFHIIYAGYGDEAIDNGQQIWAHKWQLASPITLDGVKISVYSCSPELRGNSGKTMTAIGVICHELGHVFGSPDYYDADYEGSGGRYPGTGVWDLMAGGNWNGNGATPAHINMFQKIQYGWVTPVELTSYTQVTNMLNAAKNPAAYTIKANANGEMYVLENRQKVGFDVGLPGHGLVIYHVHKDALGSTYRPNATHPQKLYVVAASSSTPIPDSNPASYGVVDASGAPFPGTSNNTAFTDNTAPQAFSWENLQGIGKPVTNISESDSKISFTFIASTWLGRNTLWSSTANWSTGQIPTAETVVTIPGNVPHFPILTESKINNVCKEIYFEAGSELGRQDLLTYTKAHVQLSTNGLARNQWHLLSMPISKVYTGDFNFGGYPYTFLRKFTVTPGENAGWEPFRNNNEPLAIGEGFALWVNSNDGLTKGNKDAGEGSDALIGGGTRQYGIGRVSGIIDFPYFEDPVISKAHRVHKYEGGKSYFYPFATENDNLPLYNKPVSVTRGADAYRLATIEEGSVKIPLVFGEDNGKYFALVGNPYMTTIDFDKLYTDNSTKIKPVYRIWTGTGFVVCDQNSYIAPMQSFFVEKADNYIGDDKLTFNIANITATGNASELR
ncbi:hypothetical protein FACS189440_04060 [Bacteroidia bacterium]|nr:hypothetical protein FACS189423_02870 [Bacteroidia bacterium]GHT46318.1 hypothetical protein FACS189440_04060 [Bacteroidia bacterium]